MKLKHLIILLSAALVAWFVIDTMAIPGVDDLKGDFKEVAMYRNENNTGPITRIYAVTVNDTLWQEMQAYGELMPHTKYGSTTVYYFLPGEPFPPEVYPGNEHFEARFQEFAVAKYEKDAMGQVTFVRHPYR